MHQKFTFNTILFIIFLCVVIVGVSYYKTMTAETMPVTTTKEGYSNLFTANAPPKYKTCSN